MKILFIVVISIILLITIFSFHITRDGKIVTPVGEGTITLDSGTYENFPLPDYAAKMVSVDYKSYFVEVEPGIKVHILEVGQGLPVFLMHGNPTSGFLYRKIADDIFLEGMESAEPPVSKWKIKSAYYAVRMFGRWAINSSAPRG